MALPGYDAVQYVRDTNAYITDYIKFGDAKAGAVLGFVTALGGVLVGSAPAVPWGHAGAAGWASLLLVLALAASFGCGILSAVFCILALAPNTPSARSLNSFPDIAHRSATEYHAQVLALAARDDLVSEYCWHNWTLANIANTKFRHIGRATRFLKFGVVASGAYGAGVVGWMLYSQHILRVVAI